MGSGREENTENQPKRGGDSFATKKAQGHLGVVAKDQRRKFRGRV